MTQKFRIWDSKGEPKTVEGERVEFVRTPEGLTITVKTPGKKHIIEKGAVGLTTVMEEKPKSATP
jgi:hypothetical protein